MTIKIYPRRSGSRAVGALMTEVADVVFPEGRPLAEVVDLGRLSFSNFSVEIVRHPFDGRETLRIRATVAALDRPGADAFGPLERLVPIPLGMPPYYRRAFIREEIRRLIMHEIDEWLTVDGVGLVTHDATGAALRVPHWADREPKP